MSCGHAFLSPRVSVSELYGTPYITIGDSEASASTLMNDQTLKDWKAALARVEHKLAQRASRRNQPKRS